MRAVILFLPDLFMEMACAAHFGYTGLRKKFTGDFTDLFNHPAPKHHLEEYLTGLIAGGNRTIAGIHQRKMPPEFRTPTFDNSSSKTGPPI